MKVMGVKDSVVESLRTQIIIGELKPGQKLNELALSSLLGISRPPLREAFRMLENEHLIHSIPRKGTHVSDLSIQDMREVFQARVMIECYAIDLLEAKNIRYLPEMESALKSTSELSVPSYDRKEEVLHYLQTIVAYHGKLIESTGNQWVQRFYNSIHSSLTRYEFIYTYVPGRPHQYRKEHGEILTLIKRGDYEKAKEFLRSHIFAVVDILEKNARELTTTTYSVRAVSRPLLSAQIDGRAKSGPSSV
jgi:DNA-binding GntR family transcriptional regulator